jgi:hypothetical protein
VTRIIGSVLVRHEDVYVERSIRNVAEFCDRIHAIDHLSTDRTWEILRRLAAELDHLEVRTRILGGRARAARAVRGTETCS